MIILFYTLVIGCLLLFPADTSAAALRALNIWGTSVVPVLFPYMLFSRQLSRCLSANNLLPIPAAALFSILGGSPSGAALLCTYASSISQASFYSLCALSGTISPMFILGTLKNWTGDPAFCRIVLISHWAGAAITAGIVYCLCHSIRLSPLTVPANAPASSANPVSQSIDAILQVGGNIIGCSVLAVVWGKLLFFLPSLHPLIHAVLEVSGGLYAVLQSGWSEAVQKVVLSGALGFSGLSLLSQNHFFLRPYGLRMIHLLVFAALRSITSALCTLLILWLLSFK